MPDSAFSTSPEVPAAELLPALLELLPGGVICYAPVTDAAGQIVDFAFAYLNPAAQRLLQLPARPGVTYRQHFAQAEVLQGLAFHRDAYLQDGPVQRTGYYQADGYDAYFTMQARRVADQLLVYFTAEAAPNQPLFDAARQAEQAREQARHAAVAAQRNELERLFEQAPLAIAILRGPELLIELANAAVGAIWGRRPAEVLGRPYFQALPETAGQGFEEILGGVLTTGQPFFVTEAPVRLPRLDNGVPVQAYVNFGFHPLRDEQGRITSVIALGTEVTEQVRARRQVQQLNEELAATNQALHRTNDELRQTNTRLAHSNRDLDTFVYTASHDLKAPITNIEGLLLALRDETAAGQWSDTAGHVLTLMQDAVERFRTTLGHLTEVTHLHPDELPAAPADLDAIVAGVQLDLGPLLAVARARVVVEAAGCPALLVPAKMLRSVVYNLLSNALKYRAPERPAEVHIRCRTQAGQAVLEVQDNGLGIDLTRQTELFGMFRRYHTHVEGAGVGLYMVKRLVEHAGGRIEVRSRLGEGSTFTVYLPGPAESGSPAGVAGG